MLSIIVAMTEERLIGAQGHLPWHLPEDLKHFKEVTMGSPVLMGRKTFESIGRVLPGRRNIIITRNFDFTAKGAEVTHSLEEALALCERSQEKYEEIFVIGGAEIFQLALPKARRLYLTIIRKRFEGDAYFPKFDLENDFKVISKAEHTDSSNPPLNYTFITAERINSI